MNIFYLESNPKLCAFYHNDRHLVKMILETAQLLFTAHHVDPSPEINYESVEMYRKTHVNHPSAVWVRERLNNYIWLVELGMELCKEYTIRYGRIHATQSKMEWLQLNWPDLNLKSLTRKPPKCMGTYEYEESDSVELSYMKYIFYAKNRANVYWKRSPKPTWFIKLEEQCLLDNS